MVSVANATKFITNFDTNLCGNSENELKYSFNYIGGHTASSVKIVI